VDDPQQRNSRQAEKAGGNYRRRQGCRRPRQRRVHAMKSRRTVMLWRIVVGGVQNFLRNAWLSIAALAVMVVTLSIVLFSYIANATFSHTIEEIRGRIDVSVFLKDEVDEEQRRNLTDQLLAMQNVRDVEYVSKEQALEEYRRINEDNIDL